MCPIPLQSPCFHVLCPPPPRAQYFSAFLWTWHCHTVKETSPYTLVVSKVFNEMIYLKNMVNSRKHKLSPPCTVGTTVRSILEAADALRPSQYTSTYNASKKRWKCCQISQCPEYFPWALPLFSDGSLHLTWEMIFPHLCSLIHVSL